MSPVIIGSTADNNGFFNHFMKGGRIYFKKINRFYFGDFRKIIRIQSDDMIFNILVADFDPVIFNFVDINVFTGKVSDDFV